MSEEARRHLSEVQVANFRRREAKLEPLVRGERECTSCHLRKRFDLEDLSKSEFSTKTVNLVSGRKHYVSSECRVCARKRTAVARERYRQAGTLTERDRKYKERAITKMGRKEARRRWRDYDSVRRRRQGMRVVGPWKRYRHDQVPNGVLDPKPLLDWLIESATRLQLTEEGFAIRLGMDARAFRRVRGQATVTWDFVDRCLTAAGEHHRWPEIYPPSDQEVA